MSTKYFIDNNGVIYSLYENGESNYPTKVVYLKGENFISVLDDDGFVNDEYFLWDSLSDLAKELEKSN